MKQGLAGGEKVGGVGSWAWKRGTLQTRTYLLEGRKRGEQVGKLGNAARHKWGLTHWRGGRGRTGLVSLETQHIANKQGLTCWRGGRGRGKWVSLETRNMLNPEQKYEQDMINKIWSNKKIFTWSMWLAKFRQQTHNPQGHKQVCTTSKPEHHAPPSPPSPGMDTHSLCLQSSFLVLCNNVIGAVLHVVIYHQSLRRQ